MATRIYAKASDVDRGTRRVIKWLVILCLAQIVLIPWVLFGCLAFYLWPMPEPQVAEVPTIEQVKLLEIKDALGLK
jgi:hypothetical protein